jgi:hypothetical protein
VMNTDYPRALVRSPVAPLFDEPRISSVQISQLLAGHHVELLEEREGWCCVRGIDQYEGWMHRGYLHENGAAYHPDGMHPARVSLGCVVLRDGFRRALPLRAYLAESDQVVSGESCTVAELPNRFPREASAITHTARRFFEGTSYLWGGVTPWGADCSGLVQTSFALHGVALPRDAWQQASAGVPVESGPHEAREGDLLFFSDRADRHITHVAIALGAGGIVHQSLGRGGFGVERMDDASDQYVTTLLERFTCARRVL